MFFVQCGTRHGLNCHRVIRVGQSIYQGEEDARSGHASPQRSRMAAPRLYAASRVGLRQVHGAVQAFDLSVDEAMKHQLDACAPAEIHPGTADARPGM